VRPSTAIADCIDTRGPITFLKVDSHFISLAFGQRPRFDSKVLSRNQAAWAEHRAFVVVDGIEPKEESKKIYAVMAKMLLALPNAKIALPFLVQN
jgi:hypothetical protein